MRAILIPTDSPARIVDLESFTLDPLYAILECDMIQSVPLRGGLPGEIILDEEGKLREPLKDVNVSATHMAFLFPGDTIVGPALVVGPYDDEGEWTEVREEVLDAFKRNLDADPYAERYVSGWQHSGEEASAYRSILKGYPQRKETP